MSFVNRRFTVQDLFFLKISENYSHDSIKLLDKLYSLGFSKVRNTTREQFMYLYEEPIKTSLFKVEYSLKILIFKTRCGNYVPVVFVKDLKAGKEFDGLDASRRVMRIINRAIDKKVGELVDKGVFVVAKSEEQKEYLYEDE